MGKMDLTRRAFLATATTSAALTTVGCATKMNTARVVPGKYSPSDKVNVAGIGVGGKGMSDIWGCRHENIVALCDVDWKRAGEAFYKFPKAKQYKDYRQMLDEMDTEIDACVISTPDHAHALAAYTAMMMGKHVYVQKPLTHTIAEARLLQETAKKTGVKTQMGNQGHCGDGVRDLCEMVWDGAIGDVKEVHIWTNRPVWPQGIPEALPAQDVPADMAWDLWIGAAPMRAYNKGYAPFNWRGWWDFGCGAIGDMACHIMDPAFWSLKLIEAKEFTVQAIYEDGMNSQTAPNASVIKYEFPARADMKPVTLYWYDGKKLPERPADIPASEQLGEGDNGSLFVGTDGYLTTGCYGADSRLLPVEKRKDYKKPAKTIERIPGEDPYRDWLRAIRKDTESASNFSYAGPLTETANLGNVALHADGKELVYNVKKMKITNNPASNQLLTKEYRKGWDILPL